MAPDVFLSYRSEDKPATERLCTSLELLDLKCWMAPRDIPIGMEWPTAIVEAIGACKIFVVVLSSHSKNAKQISREAELADKAGAQIITFRIEDVEPPSGLTYFLGNIQWLDAFDNRFDGAVQKVAELVKRAPGVTTPPVMNDIAALPPPVTVPPAQPLPDSFASTGAAAVAPRNRSLNKIIMVAAPVIVVLAIAGWFFTRPTGVPSPKPDDMAQAKFVSDRLLEERESNNPDAAWKEYTPEFQNRVGKANWLAMQKRLIAHGREVHSFNGCSAISEGYFCDYTFHFQDGTVEDYHLALAKDANGAWKITSSSIKPVQMNHSEKK